MAAAANKGVSVMMALWWQYLLDFFSVSMVIPTMGQFIISTGGTAGYYFEVCVYTSGLQLIGNLVIGTVVDRTGAVRALMIPLCLCGTAGHFLYAAADGIEALRHPQVILVARMMVALGTTKAVLVLVVLARVAKEEADRNKWVIQLATARSLGLFVGPALAVVLEKLTGGIESDFGGSIFGAFASPGLFLALSNVAIGIWVLAALRNVPPPDGARAANNRPKDGALMRFFSRKHVMASVAVCCCGLGTGLTVEFAVPVTTAQVLGWGTAGSSSVLIGISIIVMIHQAALLFMQSLQDDKWKKRLTDINITLFGNSGIFLTMLLTIVVWAMFIPVGPGAVAAARAHPFIAMGPFILAEMWLPFLGNGGNMVFTRLVITHVPQYIGICQALVVTNGPIFGQMMQTGWLGYTYSGKNILEEGTPRTAWMGMAFLQMCISAAMWTCYKELCPRDVDLQAGTPMLSITKMVSLPGVALRVTKTELEEVDDFVTKVYTERARSASEADAASAPLLDKPLLWGRVSSC